MVSDRRTVVGVPRVRGQVELPVDRHLARPADREDDEVVENPARRRNIPSPPRSVPSWPPAGRTPVTVVRVVRMDPPAAVELELGEENRHVLETADLSDGQVQRAAFVRWGRPRVAV